MYSALHPTIAAQRTAEWREHAVTGRRTPPARRVAPAPRPRRVPVPRPSAVLRRRVA
jgi:hypothetical protein